MTVAAHASTLKVGGTSTAFTNEATTKVTANTVYQITDATKRIVNPSVSVTVEVDADGGGGGGYVAADSSTYTFDYLFGKVTFLSDQGADALVRVSGSYLPTLAVAEVREWSLQASRNLPDATTLDSGGVRTRVATLKDLSGSFTILKTLFYDLDTGGGTQQFSGLFDAGTAFLLEIRPDPSGQIFRAWVILENAEFSGSLDDLVNTSVAYQGTAVNNVSYAWGN